MVAPMKTLVDDAPARPWAPKYPDIDPIEERIVMKKMRRHINKLDSVQFYRNFRDQLRTPPISEYLQEVLGSESKMEMVIYGIGKIELHEVPRRQLSLAILLKRDFEWIGDIQVFDPLLSATECKILENLGCSVLSSNEDGKRKALKPTMFFMPYCSSDLFDNLLQANWTLSLLSNIVLFGNRLKAIDISDMNHISTAKKFTLEFLIRGGPNAFIDFSWQFFRPIIETELQFMNDYALNGGRVERENCDYALNMDITETKRRKRYGKVENLNERLEEQKDFTDFLMQTVKRCMENIESSPFYLSFRDKLQNPPIFEFLHNLLGSRSMQIVICDMGTILKENAMLYLILAMVMKKDFKWIENIQVFGCILSTTECQVLEALGCSILTLEEHRLPQALKPTIFFMRDCSYNSILEANWKADLLGNMVVICGNHLKETKDSIDSLNDFIPDDDPALRNLLSDRVGYALAAQKFTNEFKFKTIYDDQYHTFEDSSCWEDYYDAFYHTTCLSFGRVTETELQFMNEVIQKGDIV